jgi:hypothetical protein
MLLLHVSKDTRRNKKTSDVRVDGEIHSAQKRNRTFARVQNHAHNPAGTYGNIPGSPRTDLAQKTFSPDDHSHSSLPPRGSRPQSEHRANSSFPQEHAVLSGHYREWRRQAPGNHFLRSEAEVAVNRRMFGSDFAFSEMRDAVISTETTM